MTPVHVVSGATHLETLIEELNRSESNALIVDGGEGEAGVVLLEEVREFEREEQLQGVLIAADVARKVPQVRPEADLVELVGQLSDAATDALLVTEPGTKTPLGVVRRTTVANVLLDWYVAELRTGSEKRASRKTPRLS